VYSSPVTGKINSVIYTKTDYSNGVVFTITAEDSGQTIWQQTAVNATATVAPRQATHGTTGAVTSGVVDSLCLGGERIKIVIASGGATKTGTFDFLVE
jgi:hypothetical protein